ncbi:MAG: hypothetical protein HYT80_00550 [Euryarchaeota archaeon]|nr:hypothetical protein [Euryarchaeota archaeon]
MPELAGHGEADPDEYYATTPPMALRSCETIAEGIPRLLKLQPREPRLILNPVHFLEPTTGAGIWQQQMRVQWPHAQIKGVELNPELAAYARNLGLDVETGDILRVRHPHRYDVIAGNPPFSLAQTIITHLYEDFLNVGGVLAFHLRLNFLGSVKRFAWWKKYRPAVVFPMPDRPGYTPDGATDGTEYAMFCWVKGYDGPTLLEHMDNTDIQVKWAGTPARKVNGTVVRPAVLDPAFPDPRRSPRPMARPTVAPAEPALEGWAF